MTFYVSACVSAPAERYVTAMESFLVNQTQPGSGSSR